MADTLSSQQQIALNLPDQAATESLAVAVAAAARQGDVIALWGDLGAGKTVFARAFIRAVAAAQGQVLDEVPSPTFTLVQIYDELTPPVWHVDLYRLERVDEAVELGLEEAFDHGVTLIEWPDRLGDELPAARLDVRLSPGADADARFVELVSDEDWRARLGDMDGGS